MFITATKIAVVEAIRSGFNAIGPASNNNTIDLVPRSVTIEYPVEEIEWPAIYVQFRPTTTQYTGLAPDIETQNQDGTWNSYRHGYFEGAFDLQILAMSSEERDRIWDTLTNYEDKYNQTLLPLDHITVVGQATYENEILNTQTYTYSSNL